MCEKTNDFDLNFIPKTDETFIAPNDKFNSFTINKKFSFNSEERHDCGPEDDIQMIEKTTEDKAKKRKIGSIDKFIDFTVNQYKSDGIVCTLDENERQIYYCYYCHQYINDFDLIQTHIDSSQHLNNVLNGISLNRGLDKEFVIESISEKPPKKLERMVRKELIQIPLHLKHYYFRNQIRLMDVIPPNAYFCKSCNKSIPSFKAIETHLSTKEHELSQEKPTLMQLIDKSEDPILKIGLQFISEEKITDSSVVVYECELCNCFDVNSEKIFSHIKCIEHRINLLKKFDYETNDKLSEEEIENLIKELHEKHGSGDMKKSVNKKIRSDPQLTMESSSAPISPLNEKSDPKLSESSDSVVVRPLTPKQISNSNENPFLLEDTFLSGFEFNKVINTYESDGREIYFCCFCDEYFNSLQYIQRHVEEVSHKRLESKEENCLKALNKRFSNSELFQKSSDLLTTMELSEIQAFNEIPLLVKHFYYKRGVKHIGSKSYYCRLCQTPIESFDSIEEHFRSESHVCVEEISTKFNDILFQTNQPIIGLKFINEYLNENSKHIQYKCSLCDYCNDFCQMFVHLNAFTHQFRVLQKLSPNNPVFKSVKEREVSLKSSDLLKEEILKLEVKIGSGFVNRIYSQNYSKESKNSTESECRRKSIESKQLSPKVPPIVANNGPIGESQTAIEVKKMESELVVESNDNQSTKMSEEMLLSYLRSVFAVDLQNEDESSALVSIVESLKDHLISYYGKRNTSSKLLNSLQKSDECKDSSNVCEMDET